MTQPLAKLLESVAELARRDEHDAAMNLMGEIARDHPNEAEVYRQRGYIHARAGDYAAAIADLSRAIEMAPREPDYFYTRGRYHVAVNDFRSAATDFTATLSLCDLYNSDYYREPAHLLRAEAYLRLKMYDQARADCDHVGDDASTWTDSLRSRKAILADCDAQE